MNTKIVTLFGTILAAAAAFAAEPAATAIVTVDVAHEVGSIKPMNAVNNGPSVKKPGGDQKNGNFEDYKALRIPFARTHDSVNCVPGGAHTCDITAVFPDFNADEKIPESSDGGRMASLPKFINDLSEHVFIIGGGASMKEVISVLNKENCCGRWYGDAPSGTISQWLLTQIDGALKPNKRVSVNGWDFIVRRTRHNKVFDALVLPFGQNEELREEQQS